MFDWIDTEVENNRLWSVAACLLALAVVVRQLAVGLSWWAENSRYATKTTVWEGWGKK